MTTQEIIKQLTDDLQAHKIWVENKEGHRVYTDGTKSVIITSPAETATNYYNIFIAPKATAQTNVAFSTLPRCTIYVGQPDTGKTYKALQLAKDLNVDSLLLMARDTLNLETLLEDFTLVEGKPVFQESLAIKMLSGTENGIIIIDEFNTLLTGVMKTLQPLLDTTSTTFEYKGKVYKKNMNCKFILTLNDKDKGISVIPDAILSRSKLEYFEQPDIDTLAQWTNTSPTYVKKLYDVYKTLGILNVFGSRQINVLKSINNVATLTNHINGLCLLRGMDTKILKTLEVQRVLQDVCTK